ncbi:hypothetical protein LMG33818_002215 [Halomonadaceae bacterium LMG 33818]|uniref:OmpA/MotB family protein n=1 Tax=Cernens ardua TaxID=3402176 RepID=UPI003EDC6C89
MLGNRIIIKRGSRDEAEKPFWISYSDMMTALMVLFLILMAITLNVVTSHVSHHEQMEQKQQKLEGEHQQEIKTVMEHIAKAAKQYNGVTVDQNNGVIDFGDRARFNFASSALTSEQEGLLRQFVPVILSEANNKAGQDVIKRVVVEGFTDRKGTYLSNLNLSLQRSERVLCTLMSTSGPNLLNDNQKLQVRDLFLVGGYSSNDTKPTAEASRRVEMRLDFLGVGEHRPTPVPTSTLAGECPLPDAS